MQITPIQSFRSNLNGLFNSSAKQITPPTITPLQMAITPLNSDKFEKLTFVSKASNASK